MINKLIFTQKIILPLLIIISLVFSLWLMFHTFSYKNGDMQITLKIWSDFSGNIPLIRSFSFGDNFPPQYPLFSGELINYHFLFYLVVGLLEKMGLPIDYALNIPSALSFTLLIAAIYLFALSLFRNKVVGLLSVIFFLFNGSLSFLEFFKNHPLSNNAINQIITNNSYPSFAPYGPGIVSAFWNLNTYINQRHFALPLTLFLLLIRWIINLEQFSQRANKFHLIAGGIFLGILLYLHSSIFIMVIAVFVMLFLLLPNQRSNIAIMGILGFIISITRIIFIKESATFTPQIKLGYLIADKLSLPNFFEYWFMNLGLFLILLPIGFVLSSKLAKKILIAFSVLFVIGNLIQFSPEIAANHKFFNVFVVVGNIFVAFAILKFWRLNIIAKLLVPFIFFFLIFSGIIDFFPIKNDTVINLADYPKNQDIAWIIANTPKEGVFLNSSYIYHPASLAGRKIFYGWPYFAWSLGYDTNKRGEIMRRIFQEGNLDKVCILLKQNRINFIDTIEPADLDFKINYSFFKNNFKVIYRNPKNNFIIYNVSKSCR